MYGYFGNRDNLCEPQETLQEYHGTHAFHVNSSGQASNHKKHDNSRGKYKRFGNMEMNRKQ